MLVCVGLVLDLSHHHKIDYILSSHIHFQKFCVLRWGHHAQLQTFCMLRECRCWARSGSRTLQMLRLMNERIHESIYTEHCFSLWLNVKLKHSVIVHEALFRDTPLRVHSNGCTVSYPYHVSSCLKISDILTDIYC